MNRQRFLRTFNWFGKTIFSANSKMFAIYLRKKGITVGEFTQFIGRVEIDVYRPCLVEIGRNCIFTDGVRLYTHGLDWRVLREKYGELLSSSGKIVVGDNVFIGANTTILKGVKIGSNTIIGAGSVVTNDIPSDSVAAGNPCKIIMGIHEYYEKRKTEYIKEAKAYALELYRKTGKVPRITDFWEEFPIFLDRKKDFKKLSVEKQLGTGLKKFLQSKPLYNSFEEFLVDSGIPIK
jgi:acetyltransferase-like isoleucine patch superfamily enzyme